MTPLTEPFLPQASSSGLRPFWKNSAVGVRLTHPSLAHFRSNLVSGSQRRKSSYRQRLHRQSFFRQLSRDVIAGRLPDRSILIFANMADREQPVTLRTRKFIRNPLLGRKQMVV